MPVLPIVRIGEPVLRRRTRAVRAAAVAAPSFRRFLADMVRTMRAAHGVGLAANQVGVGLRVCVLECRSNRRYPRRPDFPLRHYVNPRITARSRETDLDWEGCLSIPGYRGLVPRSKRIVLEALAPDGRKVRRTVRGFEARVLQHECDHLDGRFYVDRMPDLTTWTHVDAFARRLGVRMKS